MTGPAYRRAGVRQRDELTARELQVLEAMSRGLTAHQIGRELYVTRETVKSHLYRIRAVLGLNGYTLALGSSAIVA